MFSLEDHVVKKGTEQPVGLVIGLRMDNVVVRWGAVDGHEYIDEVPIEELELCKEDILSPEDVQKRQAENAPGYQLEE